MGCGRYLKSKDPLQETISAAYIAAKHVILLRLINTLYSLNEATRLASISGGALIVDGQTPRARSGQLDPNNPIFSQHETSLSVFDHPDVLKTRHGGGEEPSHASTSNSQRSDVDQPDGDRPRLSSVASEDVRQQQHRASLSANRTSTDKLQKLAEAVSDGFPVTQPQQVRPLISLLEKEPPSRRYSGQLEYLNGMEIAFLRLATIMLFEVLCAVCKINKRSQ